MKLKSTLLLGLLACLSPGIMRAQNAMIYGITEAGVHDSSGNWLYNTGAFVAYDYHTCTLDTVYAFHGDFGVQNMLSAVDPFNKRYFFVGWGDSLPGLHLFIEDILSGTYTAYPFEVGCTYLDYDPFGNRMLFVVNNQLKAFDLASATVTVIADNIDAEYLYGGSNRVLNYLNGNFSFVAGDPLIPFMYWITVDSLGITSDTSHIPNLYPDWSLYPIVSIPGDLAFDPNSNAYYGWRYFVPHPDDPRGEIIRFDPVSGEMDSLGVFKHQNRLNEQRGTFDPEKHTLLIPNYYGNTDKDSLLVFNLLTNKIDTTLPYSPLINVEQLIGASSAYLKVAGNNLAVNYGIQYKWFLNGEEIPESNQRILSALADGWYKGAVTFADGTTDSTDEIYFTSITGIHNAGASSGVHLNVTPNPFSESATITLSGEISGNVELIITDSRGVSCRRLTVKSNESMQLQKENLLPGVYWIRALQGSRLSAIAKLVVM